MLGVSVDRICAVVCIEPDIGLALGEGMVVPISSVGWDWVTIESPSS